MVELKRRVRGTVGIQISERLKVPSFAFALANLDEGSRKRETSKSLYLLYLNICKKTGFRLSFCVVELKRRVRGTVGIQISKRLKVPSFAFATANLAVGLPLAGNVKIPYMIQNREYYGLKDFRLIMRI